VNVLTCLLFGAVSGSATAAVSSIGGFMIPELVRKGYDRDFSAALNISAATTGLLIPPSNIMIVYALAAGGSVSIAALFLAGVLPGILFGVLLMVACGWISWRRGYAGAGTVSWRELGRAARGAFLSLLLVVIVLGGILAGIFTATEAAAVAVLYAFLLSVIWYRSVPWRALPRILLRAGITTAVIYLLIATSMALSWILALEEVPQRFSGFLPGLSDHPVVILLLINVLLLLVGTFMDMTPAVLIFTPILGPVAVRCGMDPVHFGIMMIANLCIGLCTPPVGTCLFVGCGVGDTTIARVTPRLLPFYAAMITGLLLVTYLPGLSLALPRLAGLK
jgi:tripartite ATP-independent transporter DctM subunit